jgi:hypothetical protein
MIYSLGFSCFSKLSIKEFLLDHRGNPFDYAITTKQLTLSFLQSIGKTGKLDGFLEDSLDRSDWQLFTMPREGTDGVLAGELNSGIYFWHSFARDGQKTLKGWENSIDTVKSKYKYMFRRLADNLASPEHHQPTTFVISNTQSNIRDFGEAGHWNEAFSLDPSFVRAVQSELQRITKGSFRLVLLVRSLSNFLELCTVHPQISNQPTVDIIFGGRTSIGPCQHLQQLLREVLFPYHSSSPSAPNITGTYDNGCQIARVGPTLTRKQYSHYAVLNSNGDFWAIITCTPHGGYSVFNKNLHFSMVVEGESLYFSNKTRWRRVSSDVHRHPG